MQMVVGAVVPLDNPSQGHHATLAQGQTPTENLASYEVCCNDSQTNDRRAGVGYGRSQDEVSKQKP